MGQWVGQWVWLLRIVERLKNGSLNLIKQGDSETKSHLFGFVFLSTPLIPGSHSS